MNAGRARRFKRLTSVCVHVISASISLSPKLKADAAERLGLSPERVLAELMSIGFANMALFKDLVMGDMDVRAALDELSLDKTAAILELNTETKTSINRPDRAQGLHISDLHRDPTNPIGNAVLVDSLDNDRARFAIYFWQIHSTPIK